MLTEIIAGRLIVREIRSKTWARQQQKTCRTYLCVCEDGLETRVGISSGQRCGGSDPTATVGGKTMRNNAGVFERSEHSASTRSLTVLRNYVPTKADISDKRIRIHQVSYVYIKSF